MTEEQKRKYFLKKYLADLETSKKKVQFYSEKVKKYSKK